MLPVVPADPETPRAAATVVLLRDAAAGPEVLLLRRHAKASNMAGVYVFPGGKLDPEDATLGPDTHLDQPHAALHERLNEPDTDPATAAGARHDGHAAVEIDRHAVALLSSGG